MVRFAPHRTGQLFQPFHLHLQPPNLLVELSLQCFLLSLLLGPPAGEKGGSLPKQLLFPLADLVRMDAELTGQLADRLLALSCLQGHPEPELSAVLPQPYIAFSRALASIITQFFHLSTWVI